MRSYAGIARNILKLPVSKIQKHLVRRRLIQLWMAVLARLFVIASRLGRRVPAQVIHDHQVQQPVVIQIHPRATHRPQRPIRIGSTAREPGLFRCIRKRAVAVIVIERVVMHASDEDVLMTVVVVIADRDADVEPCAGQSRLLSRIGEAAMPVVQKQAIGVARAGLLERKNVRAVGKEDIRISVVIGVEHGDAARHCFRRMLLRRL